MSLSAPSLAQSIAASAARHQRERDQLLRDALRLVGDLLPHTAGSPSAVSVCADAQAWLTRARAAGVECTTGEVRRVAEPAA